jgi:Holliday junction resolvase
MTYYKKRVDENQKTIVHTFIALGASVIDLSRVGQGTPDLAIGYKGKTVFVEVKSSDKAKYTESQIKFMQNWRGGPLVRVDDVESVLRVLRIIDVSEKT